MGKSILLLDTNYIIIQLCVIYATCTMLNIINFYHMSKQAIINDSKYIAKLTKSKKTKKIIYKYYYKFINSAYIVYEIYCML